MRYFVDSLNQKKQIIEELTNDEFPELDKPNLIDTELIEPLGDENIPDQILKEIKQN